LEHSLKASESSLPIWQGAFRHANLTEATTLAMAIIYSISTSAQPPYQTPTSDPLAAHHQNRWPPSLSSPMQHLQT
jgi:hypothetical protein